MKKQQFLKITKFSGIGGSTFYLVLLYSMALMGRDNFFMGMLLPLPTFLGFMGVFFAVNVFSFYLIWTNKISGYFILAAVLFIQIILFSDTFLMHWPCPKCSYFQ